MIGPCVFAAFLGSSTACIVALHHEKSILHTANLGDSGFVIIRKNAIVHRSQEQQHYFNSPFQLSIHPEMKGQRLIADRYIELRIYLKKSKQRSSFLFHSPEQASITSFNVEENDCILVATDGIWDNLPDSTILEEVNKLVVSLSYLQKNVLHIAREKGRVRLDLD